MPALNAVAESIYTKYFILSSFVKSGGTASQLLAADGSVVTAGSGITISSNKISAVNEVGIGSVSSSTRTFSINSGTFSTLINSSEVLTYTTTIITTSYSNNNNDVEVTLPSASGNEGKTIILRIMANSSSKIASVSGTVDNAGVSLSNGYRFIHYISDGSKWYLVNYR